MKTFDEAMKERFGGKVYRLSLSAGCSCPNRDGTAGWGGCIFCSEGGSGEFASSALLSVSEQIEEAKKRVASKLSSSFAGYIAYFQPFTNTYGDPKRLEKLFLEAAGYPEVLALSVATRPDCLGSEIMEVLKRISRIKPVWVELGLQTIHPASAEFIHRGYTLPVYDSAVKRLREAGIEVITHVIIGLPRETPEMTAQTVKYVADQQVDGIKLQLMQVLRNTKLARLWEEDPSILYDYSLEDYAEVLGELFALLPKDMVVHRMTGDAPKKLLLHPLWSADKKRVINRLKKVADQAKKR